MSNTCYDVIRRGDSVVVQDKHLNVRQFVVTYVDGDYDFSHSPARKSVTMLNGYDANEQPVVWRQDSDGGKIVLVNGCEPGGFRLDGERA